MAGAARAASARRSSLSSSIAQPKQIIKPSRSCWGCSATSRATPTLIPPMRLSPRPTCKSSNDGFQGGLTSGSLGGMRSGQVSSLTKFNGQFGGCSLSDTGIASYPDRLPCRSLLGCLQVEGHIDDARERIVVVGGDRLETQRGIDALRRPHEGQGVEYH